MIHKISIESLLAYQVSVGNNANQVNTYIVDKIINILLLSDKYRLVDKITDSYLWSYFDFESDNFKSSNELSKIMFKQVYVLYDSYTDVYIYFFYTGKYFLCTVSEKYDSSKRFGFQEGSFLSCGGNFVPIINCFLLRFQWGNINSTNIIGDIYIVSNDNGFAILCPYGKPTDGYDLRRKKSVTDISYIIYDKSALKYNVSDNKIFSIQGSSSTRFSIYHLEGKVDIHQDFVKFFMLHINNVDAKSNHYYINRRDSKTFTPVSYNDIIYGDDFTYTDVHVGIADTTFGWRLSRNIGNVLDYSSIITQSHIDPKQIASGFLGEEGMSQWSAPKDEFFNHLSRTQYSGLFSSSNNESLVMPSLYYVLRQPEVLQTYSMVMESQFIFCVDMSGISNMEECVLKDWDNEFYDYFCFIYNSSVDNIGSTKRIGMALRLS